jgi:hypothetical protein
VENVAQLAIEKALSDEQPVQYRWSYFLNGEPARQMAVATAG